MIPNCILNLELQKNAACRWEDGVNPLDERLLREDGFFRSLIDSSIDCVKILDLEGRLRFVNPCGLVLMEIADFELVRGMLWTDFWPLATRGQVDAALNAARRGEPTRFSADCPTAQGFAKSWDVIVTPLADRGAQIVGLIATCRDITEIMQERAAAGERELNLRRKAATLRSAGRVARLGGWEVDRRTGKVFFSAELWALLGETPRPRLSVDEAVRFFAPEHRDACAAIFGGEDGQRMDVETRVDLYDGQSLWLRVLGEPAYENGICVAVRGAAQDITEQRAARDRLEESERQARESSVAKTSFLATMGHEIRTPLNGVLGMAQAMARDELQDVQRRRLDVIHEAGATLLALLNDLLDLSKMEAGRLELEDGTVNFEDVLRGLRGSMTTVASSKDLALTFDLCPTICGAWRGDPGRIRQILYNLVSNAVKFTPNGWVHVSITRDGEHIVLRVADTGPGIPAHLMPRLFQKFAQADASTTRRFGGSGLGLSICRELVEMMGGEIRAENREGGGSLFVIRLPLQPADAPPVTAVAEAVVAPDRRLRILAAEDNAMNQLVLKTLLAQVGIEPDIVANGAEALKAWQDSRWDVILMDVQMPVMDGPEAARLIRQLEAPSGRPRTPIIALTANAMSHQVVEYLAAGMDAVVSKPIAFGELLSTIQSVVEPPGDAAAHAAG